MRQPDKPADPLWWHGALFYQIYPRSFQDTNGDGVGDLPGITRRLEYVAGLGADGVWISPFFLSPMADFGYDVADYCAVDPLFGTMDDCRALVAKAHGLGLKVLIDFVPCHTSDQHAWFRESRRDRSNPKSAWYVWADAKRDGTPPNNWLSVFGGSAWHWEARRGQYYYHAFLPAQPTLNYHEPAVFEAICDAVRFWYDLGVDGLRLDAITTLSYDEDLRDNPPKGRHGASASGLGPGLNPFLMQDHLFDRDLPGALSVFERLRTLTDGFEGRVLMGEVADVDGAIVSAKYSEGNRLHTTYNFDLLQLPFDLGNFLSVVERTHRVNPEGWQTWTVGNHDTQRLASRWPAGHGGPEERKNLSQVLLALLLSLRGCMCLYQGDELGLTETRLTYEQIQDPYGKAFYPDYVGRDGCRTPMPWSAAEPNAGFTEGRPWLPVPAEHLMLAVDRQGAQPDSLLAFVRTFTKWRNGLAPLRGGRMTFQRLGEHAVHLQRERGGETVVALFNFSAEPVEQTLGQGWHALEGSGFGGKYDGGILRAPPRSAAFARRAGGE